MTCFNLANEPDYWHSGKYPFCGRCGPNTSRPGTAASTLSTVFTEPSMPVVVKSRCQTQRAKTTGERCAYHDWCNFNAGIPNNKDNAMGINRREFLGASAATVLLANGRKLLAEEATRSKPRFRVLYSNDATNTVACVSPWHKKREPFRPEMLEATVDEVAGTGVEVHLLQPGLGWIPWWKSTVYPADEHYRWFQQRTGAEPDTFGKYMLDGGDMVSLFIDRCRQRGQSPFISLRMNDAHHLEDADLKSRAAIWASRFYVEHPEYRLGAGSGFPRSSGCSTGPSPRSVPTSSL